MKDDRIFINSVLLSRPEWNEELFVKFLKRRWDIDFSNASKGDGTLVQSVGNLMATVSYLPVPVPDGCAEQCAAANYLWPEAEEVAKSHKAHLLIVVAAMEEDTDPVETATLMTKLADACLIQDYAVGVCSDVTLYEPDFYRDMAECLRYNDLPVSDWIWLGVGERWGVPGVFTIGMRKFNREEIEVYARADYADLMEFVMNVVAYEFEENVSLDGGETIGFEPGQYLEITRSPGHNVEGESLKIQFP